MHVWFNNNDIKRDASRPLHMFITLDTYLMLSCFIDEGHCFGHRILFSFGTLAKLYATSIEDWNVVCLILISPTAMMTTETGKMPYIKS